MIFLRATVFFLICLSTAWADDWKTLLRRGEALDAARQTGAALNVLLEAEKLQNRDARLLALIAKQYGESMNDTRDTARKIELGNTALSYAKRAVAADPQSAFAQLSLAVSYGRVALLLDNRTKIAYSRLVKTHADIAVKLDPANDLAWHVLGVWTSGMASLNPLLKGVAGMIYGKLPDASLADAERYFLKAIALNSTRLGHHVELGKTYLAMGKKNEAREQFTRALAMPETQRDDAESKRVARSFLASI